MSTEIMKQDSESQIAKKINQTQPTRETSRYMIPPVDIYETNDSLTVVADLPAVEKNNLSVHIKDNVLSIQGKVTQLKTDIADHKEYELHDFYRQFSLSDWVDQDKIKAELKNGVLTLNLKKAEWTKPKEIKVEVS